MDGTSPGIHQSGRCLSADNTPADSDEAGKAKESWQPGSDERELLFERRDDIFPKRQGMTPGSPCLLFERLPCGVVHAKGPGQNKSEKHGPVQRAGIDLHKEIARRRGAGEQQRPKSGTNRADAANPDSTCKARNMCARCRKKA